MLQGLDSNITHYLDLIIDGLDEEAIRELEGAYEKDWTGLVYDLSEQAKSIIYGDSARTQTILDYGLNNYSEKIASSFEETMRINSLSYFSSSVISNFKINWHHLEWSNHVSNHKRLNVIACRGSGKSYFFSFAYPIWKMYRYKAKSAKYYVQPDLPLSRWGMLITNEMGLAKTLMSFIKDEIENNDILKERLYPGRNSGDWNKEEINCLNGAKFMVKGFGSKRRGNHPTYLIFDDYLNDQVIYSPEQNQKYIDIFFAVDMNMLEPGGQAIAVGTPFTRNDLYSELKKKKSWPVYEYPAVFPNGRLLWAERIPFDGTPNSIVQRFNDQGSIIGSRELLTKPISLKSTIFPEDVLKNAYKGMGQVRIVDNISSHVKRFKDVVIGVDLARSANVGADYSVFTVLGVDELENIWLIGCWREKGASYGEQLRQLRGLNARFNPSIIMIEVNQFQDMFAETSKELDNLPIIKHNTGTNKYDWYKGLPALSTLFELNRIKFPQGDARSRTVSDMYHSELSSIGWTDKGKLGGLGTHDDCAMSLWIGVTAVFHSLKSFNYNFI